MENVRKYFEYLEVNKAEGYGVTYSPFAEDLIENIFNKALHLSEDRQLIYAKALTERVLVCMDRAIELYLSHNRNLAIVGINQNSLEEFLMWMRGGALKRRYKKEVFSKEWNSKNGDLLRLIYKKSYKEYIEDVEDKSLVFNKKRYRYRKTAPDKPILSHDPNNINCMVAINIYSNDVDEAFEKYKFGMLEFLDTTRQIMGKFGININEFIIELEYLTPNAISLINIDKIKRMEERAINGKRKKTKQKPFKSTMTQSQLGTMFRLMRDKGIFNATDTQLYNYIGMIADWHPNSVKREAFGTNADISKAIKDSNQIDEVVDVFKSIAYSYQTSPLVPTQLDPF